MGLNVIFLKKYISEDNHTYTLIEERTENQFWSSGKIETAIMLWPKFNLRIKERYGPTVNSLNKSKKYKKRFRVIEFIKRPPHN